MFCVMVIYVFALTLKQITLIAPRKTFGKTHNRDWPVYGFLMKWEKLAGYSTCGCLDL